MKHNYLLLTAIAFVLSLAFAGCKKQEQEILTPKIIDDKVETTATTATFTWTVDWPGKLISVVEVSKNEDMSHSQFYGSEDETENHNFTVTVTGLEVDTKYYYRYVVWNHFYVDNKFVMEVKSFTTKTDVPKVKTVEVTDVTRTTATVIGEVTDECGSEVTERGVCWGTSHNPMTSGSHLNSGIGIGSYSIAISNLEVGKTYYVRAYAKNSNGTAYGEELDFVTGDAVKPTVTTAEVTNIDWRTATGGGEVTDDGDATVTERGVCWSTSHNPEVSGSHANNGTGTGSYTVDMTGLTAGATYYVRAYAKNIAGLSYGNEVSFAAKAPELPVVTTSQVTDVTQTTATGGGNVTSDGGDPVTERGIFFGTSPNPAATGTKLVASSAGTGSFTCTMTGLVEETTYYVCAYATNSLGIGYGTELNFMTIPGQTFTVNGVSFTMKRVEGGTFWMGAQSTNPNGQNYDSEAFDKESPVHSVTLSTFYMGETEVTQELWQAVMGSNPSDFSGTNLPVERVSWNMIVNEFLPALNAATGQNFRLPTEAEWEYAARGGNQGHGYKYAGSNTIGNVAWYTDNSNNQTHSVATKSPNELGLYDMSGNVWEWCSDWYSNYSSGSQTNPQGPSSGSSRVLRGGSWLSYAGNCRVSRRDYDDPGVTYIHNGFRLALPQ